MWLRVGLVCGLVIVVAMAFRVSWNGLRDVALAIGVDEQGADIYAFVVDGLMVVALVASLYLVGRDRTFALCVLGGYTLASLVLNYVHGLMPDLHEQAAAGSVRLSDEDWVHYVLVGIASALPVGSIYFGSDLVAKVLHHRPAPAQSTPDTNQEETPQHRANQSPPDQPESAPAAPPPVEEPAPVTLPEPTVDPAPTAPPAFAASAADRPRRATGRVPAAARSPRPTRTPEQLLIEAREATADWPDADLTAEAIRKAVRTAPAKARALRDTLRAERAERHVTAADPVEVAA
ncbi:DUF2637 domain-containing protein [Streptomyces marincola]|uniref:DUF2637 domain-containing protein n=1 Tax=Streptomyces marincola TaxID=2878388 RepID=UPI001CF5EE34|nr:DUF2637 domain-containing protein [Streptomyces marincola]UCM91842.1 DUF2637 domain-containing protein [Streptomyces marincola]